MKQVSPVHFVAGLFQAIAPDAQRVRRTIERRGVLGMPHAAEVHRLDMHAPERLKSDRTAVRAHAVTIAPRPPFALRLLPLVLPLRRFLAQIPQTLLTLAQIFQNSPDAAPTAPTLPAKDRVVGNIPRRPDGRRTRSQRGSTSTDCWPLPRNGAIGRFSSAAGEPENLKWNENKISERCAGFGRLQTRETSARE